MSEPEVLITGKNQNNIEKLTSLVDGAVITTFKFLWEIERAYKAEDRDALLSSAYDLSVHAEQYDLPDTGRIATTIAFRCQRGESLNLGLVPKLVSSLSRKAAKDIVSLKVKLGLVENTPEKVHEGVEAVASYAKSKSLFG